MIDVNLLEFSTFVMKKMVIINLNQNFSRHDRFGEQFRCFRMGDQFLLERIAESLETWLAVGSPIVTSE